MRPLAINDLTRVLVLTGAGVSAESGIPTFRDANGLWRSNRFEEVASPEGFHRNPQLVWQFYSERRQGLQSAMPNEGHKSLASLEGRLGTRFLLVTQNVDGLHQRAGSKRVIEMHGSLLKSRCSACDRAPYYDPALYFDSVPTCDECRDEGRDGLLRPHIVWFGEGLDLALMTRVRDFMNEARDHLLFLAVGTSGNVFPASLLVDDARALGGRTVLVNRDEAANASHFDQVIKGKSGEILPALLG